MYEGWMVESWVDGKLTLKYGALTEVVTINPPLKTIDASPTKNNPTYEQIDVYDALNLTKAHAADIVEQHPYSCTGVMQLANETRSQRTSKCLTCGTRVTSSISTVEVAESKRLM